MATINVQRHQMIRRLVIQRPEAMVDVSIRLWERLVSELTSIIGDGGFQSLYSRSIHLTNITFPWIAQSNPTQRIDPQFTDLKMSLEGQDFTEASEASITLLITFSDILVLLIGESLATGILHSAWGGDDLNIAGKEIENE